MFDKRTYGDSCGIARALDRVGERWALLVVRELTLGPKRFTDLRDGLPGIGPDVLAQRLRDLEAAGVIRRRKLPPPAAARVYELTEWGAELEPVLIALGRWGSRTVLPERPPPLSPDALALALETTYAPTIKPAATSYQIILGEHAFLVTVGAFGIELTRGVATDPAFVLRTDTNTLAALLWHGLSIEAAAAADAVALEGDPADLVQFLDYFPGPVPVAV